MAGYGKMNLMVHSIQPTSEHILEFAALRMRLMRARGIIPLLLGPLMIRDADGVLPDIGVDEVGRQGLPADLVAEFDHLLQDHLPHLRDLLDDFEREVEGSRARGLVRGVVPDSQVAVVERFLDRDARAGVEREHLVQQVQGVRVCVGEETVEGDLGHEREIAHVVLCSRGADSGESLFVRRAEVVEDLVQLVDVVATLEEWPATEEFGQDTAD